MKIYINNEERETAAATMDSLAAELDLPGRGVAVAKGDSIVPRAEWAATGLAEGDRVTVIKAAFGG